MNDHIRLPGRVCGLRDWLPADVPAYRDWQRPHHRWHDTNGPYFGRPTDADADKQAERLAQAAATAPADRPVPRTSLAIVADDGPPVGTVTWYWECQPTNWRRLGVVVFDPRCWGRGVGTEALALWTTYLFEVTDARRLDFATYSGNEAMCAVGRKLGFREEARFREARPYDGQVHDSVVYGVLRAEWLGGSAP